MKRKINKKNIPGYAYGASEVTSAVTNGLASTIPYATSGLATVGTALGGMASGAAAGAALGPWGAVAGAAIGGIMGSMGSAGSVDEQTGQIEEPSGILGLFGHSKGYLKRKSNRIVNSNLGRQMTDMLRADYYNNSTAEYNPNTFAEGGTVGERATIRMSKGEIAQDKLTKETYSPSPNAAPNSKDDVIVNAHVGDSIMSNKRKDIDKSMTNAQWAKKFIKPNKKAKDKYAQGTLDAQDLLWQIGINKQEEAKVAKQTTNGYAGGTPKVEKSALDKAMERFSYTPDDFVKSYYDRQSDQKLQYTRSRAGEKSKGWQKFADAAPAIGQLAAPILNIAKGKQKVQPVEARLVSPTYARTTVDNRPLIRQVGATDAITRYNADNLGGEGMAYALQSAINTNRGLADIYSDTYNKEITLAHQNAQTANRAKEFNANALHTADVEYAQNLAARDNIWSTGVGQLGQMIGGIGRDRAMSARDAALYSFMRPYFEYGADPKYLEYLDKIYE